MHQEPDYVSGEILTSGASEKKELMAHQCLNTQHMYMDSISEVLMTCLPWCSDCSVSICLRNEVSDLIWLFEDATSGCSEEVH